MKIIFNLILIMLISNCAKAQLSLSRISYLKDQDHGYIEIQLNDDEIYETDSNIIELCGLEMSLNNETFLSETLYPFKNGDNKIIKTGFKTIVPVGSYLMRIKYSDCKIDGNEKVDISFEKIIHIEKNMIYKYEYGKFNFIENGSSKDSTVTLEDINKKLDRIEQNYIKNE